MRHFLFLLTLSFLCINCTSTKPVSYHSDPSVQLQQILDEDYIKSQGDITGVSLTVISPELGIDFSGAIGYDSVKNENALTASQPFRVASLTKVFVATAILRLREQGLLSIEDPISKYISPSHIEILKSGGYHPDQILIRHCLDHTSGLYDYAEGGPEYIEIAIQNPTKRWTRTEQIQFAMDYGKPHAASGEEHHYSDTGYVLLGEIIEQLTNDGLAKGLRDLLKFDTLGMTSTYLESLEDRPQGIESSVQRYLGDINTTQWDNSVDLYGGGGLVSTTRDLSVFLQALFSGGVFEKEDTLDVMLLKKEHTNLEDVLPEQRLGFGAVVGKKSGAELYMHSGFWGTLFAHYPKFNTSIAINNTVDGDSEVFQKVINYIKWLSKNKTH